MMIGSGEETPEEETMESQAPESQGVAIPLPAGFKAPDGTQEGQEFTTTVTGKIEGGSLVVSAIGDMPVDGGQPSDEDGSAEPLDDGGADMAATDKEAAQAAFRSRP